MDAPAPEAPDPRLLPNVEHRCKCAGIYMIATLDNGQLSVFHKNPPCDDFRMRGGKGYLDWVLSKDGPTRLSRKHRRRLAAMERAKVPAGRARR
jgi:hypothetical protein